MQCVEVRKKLDPWLDDELPTHESDKIARHLKRCPACQREAAKRRRLMAGLDGLPGIRAPGYLSRNIRVAFRAELEKPGMAEWWRSAEMCRDRQDWRFVARWVEW